MTRPIPMLLALAGAAALPTLARAQDPAAGHQKAAMCIGCHGIPGYQASFPEIHKVPKIAGQNARFIVAALNAYKKGERKHPTMKAIAGSLTDQDMGDLAAYYETLGTSSIKPVADTAAAPPPPDVAALLSKGNCASCHGANFSKAIDPSYPKLAGQYADYLFVALKAYQTEGNPQIGRANPIMGAQVKPFKRTELEAIAKYRATLPGDIQSVAQPRLR